MFVKSYQRFKSLKYIFGLLKIIVLSVAYSQNLRFKDLKPKFVVCQTSW